MLSSRDSAHERATALAVATQFVQRMSNSVAIGLAPKAISAPLAGTDRFSGELRGGRPQSRATRADGSKPLPETGPRPRLELGITPFVLTPSRLQILEPCVRLFDVQQLVCELHLRHLVTSWGSLRGRERS
jgi:hypothetical protein